MQQTSSPLQLGRGEPATPGSEPRAKAPPRRSARSRHGPPPAVDFTNLVGRLTELNAVIEHWTELPDQPGPGRIPPPGILPLPPEAEEYTIDGLRIAVVRHRPGLGPEIVSSLRSWLDRRGLTAVLVEEGYFLSPASATGQAPRSGPGAWSVTWDAKHLSRIRRPVKVPLRGDTLGAAFAGRWPRPRAIALIDTGDEGAASQIGFEQSSTGPEAPSDRDGHGTTVGSLIRAVAPDAEVHSFRVLGTGHAYIESAPLLNALTWATIAIGRFHVVCAALRAELSVDSFGQRDALAAIVHQNATGGLPVPLMVCAAGNRPPQRMGYPAVVPGVVTAAGVDWSGDYADYNCKQAATGSVHVVRALGGTEREPLGYLKSVDGRVEPLYGSSYAAALVAGSLVT